MTPAGRRLRIALGVAGVLTLLAAAYGIGYRAGLADRGPLYRALMVVRRTKGDPSSVGTSATWFDIRNPQDAARLRAEEERLEALGIEYYVAKGVLESTLKPERDPGRVNSRR